MEALLQPWYVRTGTSGPYQENSCLTVVEETKFHFLWAVLCFAFLTCSVCFPLVFYIFILCACRGLSYHRVGPGN